MLKDFLFTLVRLRKNGVGEVAVFRCELYGKVSKNKHNMKRHMKLMHTTPTNNACQYCSKVFPNSYNLNRHIKSRHLNYIQPPPSLE